MADARRSRPPTRVTDDPPLSAGFDVLAERLAVLCEFVAHVGPCVGERRDGDFLADADCHHVGLVDARNDALIQAYEGISRLAARV